MTERAAEQVVLLPVGCALFALALRAVELISNVPFFSVTLT